MKFAREIIKTTVRNRWGVLLDMGVYSIECPFEEIEEATYKEYVAQRIRLRSKDISWRKEIDLLEKVIGEIERKYITCSLQRKAEYGL